MNKLIDMHTHTCFSDGVDTPKELLKKAEGILDVIAITDHDTIEGLKTLSSEDMSNPNLKVVSGIEVSGKTDVGQLHILGYDININNHDLNDKMKWLKELSILRVKKMIDYLSNKWKIHFEEEELESLYNAIGNIGRPNISRLLLKHGYVKTNQEGFDKYLIEAYDSIRDLKLELPPEEAIELIVEANGIPVLAHPYSLKKDLVELRQYIKELMNYGLQGIEVYHSNHSPEFMNELSKISDEYGMLVSGGSDYHGFLIKPSVKLGIGKDNLSIKHLSLLDKIKAKR